MSRLYSATIEIKNYKQENKEDIKEALREEWGFDDWVEASRHQVGQDTITSSAENYLCGGELEDEFSKRMAESVWEVNQGPCEVSLSLAFLEDLPYETYSFNEEDYINTPKHTPGPWIVDEMAGQ